ncbi:MAG: EamA family transporter [Chloroflexi bacterium]|nr:EamA family transporter [Chloroflexota bacterium]
MRDASWGYAIALASAFSYGTSHILARVGVTQVAPPLVGASISLLAGTFLYWLVNIRSIKLELNSTNRRGVAFFALSGITSSMGLLFFFFALSKAPVIAVSPVANTYPLIALLLSSIFLQGIERITPKLALGAFLVVLGLALIIIGRAI